MRKILKYTFILFIISILILWLTKTFILNHDYKITKYNEDKYEKDLVISFHGIYGTEKQLRDINEALARENYQVINIQYPTLEDNIQEMTEKYIKPVIEQEEQKLRKINLERKKENLPELKINFIVHSMGTVLLRNYLKENQIENLGEVIMISPPSHGSQLSDNPLASLLKYFLGKAPLDLKTDKNSFVNRLGEPTYKAHIFIGNKSNNFLYSIFIKGQDDGMVPIASSKLENSNFEIIEGTTHTSILKDKNLINKITNLIK